MEDMLENMMISDDSDDDDFNFSSISCESKECNADCRKMDLLAQLLAL